MMVWSIFIIDDNDYDNYYKGVLMALGCSIMGSLINILIKKCEKIRSTVLVFYSGGCGIIVSLISWIISPDSKLMLLNFEEMKISNWALIAGISIIGKVYTKKICLLRQFLTLGVLTAILSKQK